MNGNSVINDRVPECGMAEGEHGCGIGLVMDAVRRHLLFGCCMGTGKDMLEQLAGRIGNTEAEPGRKMDESTLLLLIRLLIDALYEETEEAPDHMQGEINAYKDGPCPAELQVDAEQTDGSEEYELQQESEKGDDALHHGCTFWCGSASLPDGKIEEVHSYKEALKADFHVAFYFSQEQFTKLCFGKSVFFCLREGGKVEVDWEDPRAEAVAAEIRRQIMYIWGVNR